MAKNKNKKPAPEAVDTSALDAALELDTVEAEIVEQADVQDELPDAPDVVEQDAVEPTEETPVEAEPVLDVKPKFKTLLEDEVVTDEEGNTRFKRKAPTRFEAPAPKKKERTRVTDRRRLALKSTDGTTANSAHLEWPTDRWGVTKDLKKALTDVASRIAGDQAKKELTDEVLRIGLAHLEAKFTQDHTYRATRQKEVRRAEIEANKKVKVEKN